MPLAFAIVGALLLAVGLPHSSTGAYWTATATPAGSVVGQGQWCAAPNPAVSGARFIRLNTFAATSATNQKMIIVPVANNTAWGGGSGASAKNLSVRLWGCQETPVNDLRITAWSNASSGALAPAWVTGSTTTVAPTSRLDPLSGLGSQLSTLARSATVRADYPLITPPPNGDARRYSWIIANDRTSATPAADPGSCSNLLSAIGNCLISLTELGLGLGKTDSSFAQVFNTSQWSTPTISPVNYPARTFALQTSAGWGTTGAWFNVTCTIGLLCTTNTTNTFLTGTGASDSTLLATTDGNQLQWVVMQWTGTTPPPDDLVAEIVLS
ncbi:hypothetical protein [Glaciihabitans sp. dw_435]|uniref:hypothetical protein n=1 Tax=Glaciihabitans sp. dw_435 TaxID=2720081 RepID=UPI001BD401ED|nr:hypothetical protein [Glaciihabitans sp. dw_435]